MPDENDNNEMPSFDGPMLADVPSGKVFLRLPDYIAVSTIDRSISNCKHCYSMLIIMI